MSANTDSAEKVVAELRAKAWNAPTQHHWHAVLLGQAAALIESQRAELADLREQVADETRDFDGGYEAGQSDMQNELEAAEARVTALEAEKAGYIAALVEADATLTSEDACDIEPIVGSHNPHENAAGLVRQALSRSSTEVKNDGA